MTSSNHYFSDVVGGFGELELPRYDGLDSLFKHGIFTQSARSALYLYLKAISFSGKVFVPDYICPSVIDVFSDLKIPTIRYKVCESTLLPLKLEPTSSKDFLLLINYFGLLDSALSSYLDKGGFDRDLVILDNSQALFSSAFGCSAVIYSPRKFIGMPDGGVLISNTEVEQPQERFFYPDMGMHLLLRSCGLLESGYSQFSESEERLSRLEPMRMSKVSERLASSISFSKLKKKRRHNFQYLHNRFSELNQLKYSISGDAVPLCYPLYLGRSVGSLVKHLVRRKCFLPRYWFDPSRKEQHSIYENTLFLPVDHRIDDAQLELLADEVEGVASA